MKKILFSISLLTSIYSNGQSVIQWDGQYQLQFSDFQSKATQLTGARVYSINPGDRISFAYNTTNGQLLFTKNFNSTVSCSFNREIAALMAPDEETANALLNYARYEFDLSELYARKLRKRFYEGKTIASGITFFDPLYDAVQKEYSARNGLDAQETDMGRNEILLKEKHEQVLKEIADLEDFCKTCKPAKKHKV
ncbi:hypothetical protein [Taibaiella soli]|uniref:Uncharacterized protein n=1 Tax=Taibaiella soli TaxID=1649169 RepID=A0A2W2A9G6_9BACT|nr:hypothetical protein [Taibaiella soli]PZF72005.1 hypothetical protein DN068_15330 [Taibaiella soli]